MKNEAVWQHFHEVPCASLQPDRELLHKEMACNCVELSLHHTSFSLFFRVCVGRMGDALALLAAHDAMKHSQATNSMSPALPVSTMQQVSVHSALPLHIRYCIYSVSAPGGGRHLSDCAHQHLELQAGGPQCAQ